VTVRHQTDLFAHSFKRGAHTICGLFPLVRADAGLPGSDLGRLSAWKNLGAARLNGSLVKDSL
jgi:hypothetical protein